VQIRAGAGGGGRRGRRGGGGRGRRHPRPIDLLRRSQARHASAGAQAVA
jgi:hypothetical protein